MITLTPNLFAAAVLAAAFFFFFNSFSAAFVCAAFLPAVIKTDMLSLTMVAETAVTWPTLLQVMTT